MRVYLFRGLFGAIFSTGMDELAKKAKAAGHQVSVHPWIARKSVQRKAIKMYKAGKLRKGIAIGGHSLGGNSASYMTFNLMKAGVPVNVQATWDATEPMKVPSGVKAINFMSHDLRAEKVPGSIERDYTHLNHIQVDKDDSTHRTFLDAIKWR